MGDFLLTVYPDTVELGDGFDAAANKLVTCSWQTLYHCEDGPFKLSWSGSDYDFVFIKDKNRFALVMGWPYPRASAERQLLRILREINPENAPDLVRNLDGRYMAMFIAPDILCVTTDQISSVRSYFASSKKRYSYSSSMKCLAAIHGLKVNPTGVKQKLLFHTNYRSSLLDGVKYLNNDACRVHSPAWAETAIETNLSRLQLRQEFSSLTERETIETAGKLVQEGIANSGLPGSCCISLSAGRDSRAILGELLRQIDPASIFTVTKGGKGDYESSIASRVAKATGINHEVLALEPFRPKDVEDFVWMTEDFDFGIISLNRYAEILHRFGTPIVETNSPEIFWGHTEYGEGDGPFHRNFVRNRHSAVPNGQVPGGREVAELSEEEASLVAARFPDSLPDYSKTNLLDFVSFQGRWCYFMHRIYDNTRGCANVYQRQAMYDLFLSLPLNHLHAHRVYRSYCLEKHARLFALPSSRDFNSPEWPPRKANIQGYLLGKYYRRFGRYAATGGLIDGSAELRNYINENRDILADYVMPEYMNLVVRAMEDPRSTRLVSRDRRKGLRNPYTTAFLACIAAWHKIIDGKTGANPRPAKVITVTEDTEI